MAKFLLKSTYTVEGLQGLLKDGGSRRADAVRKTIESLGGHMAAFNFAFGEDDTYVLCELPDQRAAAAVAIAVGAAGGASVQITPLLTPEEIDGAARQTLDYRPPGD